MEEDPWGSPWADQSDKPAKPLLLSPPPRAFFGGPSSSNSVSPSTQLPWADSNNASDDWSALGRRRSSQSGWSPWADSPSKKSDSTLKQEAASDQSTPLRKPSSIAASPGLQPLPRSRSSSIFRHHSPDPWAATISRTTVNETPPITPPNAQLEPHVSSILSSLDASSALIRPESPITPNGDEPKIRQGPIEAERTSGPPKRPDALTHITSEEPPSPKTRAIPSRQPEKEDEGPKGGDSMPNGSDDTRGDEEPKKCNERNVDAVNGFANAQDSDRRSLPTKPKRIDLIAKLTKAYGPIHFQPNIEALDGLFSKESIAEPAEPANIPDRVVSDSFTELSQRKVWYRISRYGSKKMHDSGQEQSYHRPSWKSSTVHRDAMAIVRRWMQEDSVTGTATLGGMKGSVFNWDSPAAPVNLELVFKRNSSLKHSKNSSQVSHTVEPAPSPMSPLTRGGPQNGNGEPSPPAPAFGWSSTKETNPPTRHINSLPPPPSETQPAKPSSRLRPAPVNGEDDDDWGEMVTS